MLRQIGNTRGWPIWIRLGLAAAIAGATFALQIPFETHVPGEPFLLFFIVVVASTVMFGNRTGYLAAGLTTIQSCFFFEPGGALALHLATDLIKVELYAFVSFASVLAVGHLISALAAAEAAVGREGKMSALFLQEVTHSMANNFAVVAALISEKSRAISDARARSVLREAVEQIAVMAHLHRHLHADRDAVTLDSERFIVDLCAALEGSLARARPVSIKCAAVRHRLPSTQAVAIGLIVNELVTNAIKYAFPDGRSGTVRVTLQDAGDKLLLVVADDGVGADQSKTNGTGLGLVRELAEELGGHLKYTFTNPGSSFSVDFVCAAPAHASPPIPSSHVMH